MHLANAFIQSDLQCIQAIHLHCQYVCSLGIEPTIFALLTQCSNLTTEPQEHLCKHLDIPRQTPGQSISDHRTSYQLQSHHVADTSHKDTDNTMQPKQPLLMDIPAEPCHRAHHIQTVTYYNSSKTRHPRTTLWKTAREARITYHSQRKNKSQSPSQMETDCPSLQYVHF